MGNETKGFRSNLSIALTLSLSVYLLFIVIVIHLMLSSSKYIELLLEYPVATLQTLMESCENFYGVVAVKYIIGVV